MKVVRLKFSCSRLNVFAWVHAVLNQALLVDGKNPSFNCPEAPNLFVNLWTTKKNCLWSLNDMHLYLECSFQDLLSPSGEFWLSHCSEGVIAAHFVDNPKSDTLMVEAMILSGFQPYDKWTTEEFARFSWQCFVCSIRAYWLCLRSSVICPFRRTLLVVKGGCFPHGCAIRSWI
jgi:hypothetical protein